ncbi:unnamed protein product [Candidula unifasciata]|uniref:Gem-associated protein 2 n=1 Tax=Candidula unifasciata TaxID=100452 RepID=A0A8S3YZH3_9EUPU|nr:unnamed protein product [Candidula unifasciata]
MDDSDSDGPNEQAFAIDDCNNNDIDLSVPPTSGTEYLRRVRQEAMEYPKVVVADLDTSLFIPRQTVKVSEPGGLLPVPANYKAPMSWQRLQVAEFASLRQKLIQFRALVKLKKIAVPAPKLPHATHAQGWCKLCFGRLKPKSELLNTSSEAAGERPLLESSESEGTPPLLHIVAHMDQQLVTCVLEYHINWLEATGFTSRQGQWFYALLASLQKPLTPEVCSWIRRLARLCSNIRASLESSSDPRLNELNLIICLVSRYFDQRDLADSWNS